VVASSIPADLLGCAWPRPGRGPGWPARTVPAIRKETIRASGSPPARRDNRARLTGARKRP